MSKKIKSNFLILLGVLSLLVFLIINCVYIGFDDYVGQTITSKIDINTEHDIYVEDILVTVGKKVKQGDVLMVLKSVAIENENAEIEVGLKNMDKVENLEASTIQANIIKIKTEKNQKLAELQAELKKAQQEAEFQQKIFLSENRKVNDQSKNVLIETIKEQIKTTTKEYDDLLAANYKILNLPQQGSIDAEVYKQKKSNNIGNLNYLKITAPYDGIISTIYVSKGQFVSRHGALLNFSEIAPSKSIAFVYERKTLSIKEGDSVNITSRYNTKKSMKGKVLAIGNKFVLMPQKISEIPNLEFFGREIYISNFPNNSFLDNESIIVNKIEE